MGAVGPLVVHATFFNFHPVVVERAMDGLWDRVGPEEVLAARHRAADRALRRLLGDTADDPAVRDAVELVRPAVEAARARPEGRPLFAGHARLPEPEQPHLALWWAVTLLREFRGDGHVAALTEAGLAGVEALVLHGASGEVPAATLRTTRGWPEDQWNTAVVDLVDRGLVERAEGAGALRLSDDGARLRAGIEQRTDELAAPAWQAISVEEASRLRATVRPWSKVIAAGMSG